MLLIILKVDNRLSFLIFQIYSMTYQWQFKQNKLLTEIFNKKIFYGEIPPYIVPWNVDLRNKNLLPKNFFPSI